MICVQYNLVSWIEVEGILVFLTGHNRVCATQLLYHCSIQSNTFLQLRCNDKSFSFQLCHFRLSIYFIPHCQNVRRNFSSISSKYASQSIKKWRFAVRARANTDNDELLIHLTNSCQSDNLLYILDQFCIPTKKGVQCIQPDIHSFISRRAFCHFGNKICRIMWLCSCHAKLQVVCRIWRIQQIRILIKVWHFNTEHGLRHIQSRGNVFVIPAFHRESQVLLCSNEHIKDGKIIWLDVRLSNQHLWSLLYGIFWIASLDKCFLGGFHIIVCILQLQIEEFHTGSDSHLLVLYPHFTIVYNEICGWCIFHLITICGWQHFRLSYIWVIIRP